MTWERQPKVRRKISRRRTRCRSSGDRWGPGWRKAGRLPSLKSFMLVICGHSLWWCSGGCSGEVEGRHLHDQGPAMIHAVRLIRSVLAGRRQQDRILGVTMRLLSVGVAVYVSMIDDLAHAQYGQDCDRDDRPGRATESGKELSTLPMSSKICRLVPTGTRSCNVMPPCAGRHRQSKTEENERWRLMQ